MTSRRLVLGLDWALLVIDVPVAAVFLLFGLIGMWTDEFFLRVFIVGGMAGLSVALIVSAMRRTRRMDPYWARWQSCALAFGLGKLPLLVAIYGAGPGPHK